MFPSLDIDKINQIEVLREENFSSKSFLFDFEKGDFVTKDGKLVEVVGNEAIKVWIEKILRTEKLKFKIYKKDDDSDEYGTTIKKLIQGRKLPQFFLQSELKRQIEEALSKNVEIDRIENFSIKQDITTVLISFTVILKSGVVLEQEVRY